MGARRWRRAVGAGLAALALLAAPGLASGSALPERVVETWVPNGSISSAAFFGGRLIVGGSFSGFAPRSGPAVLLDRASGRRLAFPRVEDGWVTTAIGDGAGGWYLGGSFTHIDGVARALLAHVRADGTLDRGFDAHVEGYDVLHLALGAQGLYVAGDFDRIGGVARPLLARVDPATGAVASWDPGEIRFDLNTFSFTGLVVAGGAVWVSGWFRQIGGASAANLAALDETTAAPRAFDPGVDREIVSLTVDGSTVIATGPFTRAGGELNPGIAAWDAATGATRPLPPLVQAPFVDEPLGQRSLLLAHDGTILVGTPHPRPCDHYDCGTLTELTAFGPDGSFLWRNGVSGVVGSASLDGGRILLGGTFFAVDGKPRRSLAALDARTGELLDWAPAAGPAGRLAASVGAFSGAGGILVGGYFDSWGGVERRALAALDPRTGRPLPWAPRTGGETAVLPVVGDRLYVLSSAPRIAGRLRPGGASFDRSLDLTGWRPEYKAGAIVALGPDRVAVATGCADGTVGPVDLLDAATGRPVPGWGPRTPTDCHGGPIARVDGLIWVAWPERTRLILRAFDETDGRLVRRLELALDSNVSNLAVAGGRLYVAGYFRRVAGERREGLAAIDLRTGRLESWAPRLAERTHPSGHVTSLHVVGDAVVTGGLYADRQLVAFDARTAKEIRWRLPAGLDHPFVLAASPGAILLFDGSGILLLRR